MEGMSVSSMLGMNDSSLCEVILTNVTCRVDNMISVTKNSDVGNFSFRVGKIGQVTSCSIFEFDIIAIVDLLTSIAG